jgi:hypothetical protein
MPEPSDSHPREADRLIYAGLLGLAVASVLQVFEREETDLAQEVGLHAFALAIPLLAVGLITDYARRAGTLIPGWYNLIGLLGAFASIVGFGALLFHFGIGVGLIFAVGSVLCFLLVRRL